MHLIAFDCESKGLDWWNPEQRAFLVSWATPDKPQGWHARLNPHCGAKDMLYFDQFVSDLDNADVVIGHNLGFDIHQLRETCGIDLLESGKELIDTANLARVVLPERRINDFAAHGEGSGYRLKDLAVTYVDDKAQDGEAAIMELAKQAGIKLKDVGGYYDTWRAYPEEMEFYAREDARITLALYHVLAKKLNASNRQAWELEHALFPILLRAEAKGVGVDQSKVGPLLREYQQMAWESEARVKRDLGEAALEGTDALKEALLAHGVPLYRETPTGELATNQFALAEFEADYPVLQDLMQYRTATKFLSTYIEPMVDVDAVHPSFWQMGAITDRMSCSRPNMQNIPVRAGSEVREVFVPRPGMAYVVHDYDSIELRMLAYYLNDEDFKRQVADGVDVFAKLAAVIYGPGGPLADGSSGDPADYEKGTDGAGLRGNCKNVVYAISYGAGRARITDMLGLDPVGLDSSGKGGTYKAGDWMVQRGFGEVGAPMHMPAFEVAKLVKSWLPNYNYLAKRVRAKVEACGYVNTITGRKLPVRRDKGYVGLNALIQGGAAEIFKRGVVLAAPRLAPLGYQPVLFVHDELVSEGPTEHAEEAAAIQAQAMRDAWELDPPLEVSGGIVHTNYASAK